MCELTHEEIDTAVERVVQETLWEADIHAPPVDAIRAARRLGCVVVAMHPGASRAQRVRLARQRERGAEVILLAPEDRPERRQWAAAHELGERSAHRVFARLGVSPDETPQGAREQAANRFASCLLLPSRWFLAEALDSDWDLFELKNAFPTASHELIARRLLDLHPAPVAVSVIDNGEQTWRRGAPWRAPAPCPAELDAWRCAHEAGKPVQSFPRTLGVARVRAWPVHELDWRREIVLTEFEE